MGEKDRARCSPTGGPTGGLTNPGQDTMLAAGLALVIGAEEGWLLLAMAEKLVPEIPIVAMTIPDGDIVPDVEGPAVITELLSVAADGTGLCSALR